MSLFHGAILALLLMLTGQFTIPQRTGATAAGSSPFNPCLISAWPMNEGSGLTLNDVSGNSNTATISAGAAVTWTANAIKSGVTSPSWNAAGFALASSTSLTNFTGTTPFSLSAWEDTNSSGNQTVMGTLNTSSNFQGWEMLLGLSGSAYFINFDLISNNGSGNLIDVRTTATYSPNALHYVVITYDGSQSATGVKIYIDGTAVATTTLNNGLTATAVSGQALVFGSRYGGSLKLSGPMGYAEIYNCALTSTQVSTYNAAGPGIY